MGSSAKSETVTEPWWILDKHGAVHGPVTLEVIRRLVDAGRLRGVERVSRNRAEWMRATRLPYLRRA